MGIDVPLIPLFQISPTIGEREIRWEREADRCGHITTTDLLTGVTLENAHKSKGMIRSNH